MLQGSNGNNNMGIGGGSGPGPQMKPDPGNMLPTSPGSNILPASMISSLSDFADDAMSLGSHHSLAGRYFSRESHFDRNYITPNLMVRFENSSYRGI